MRGVVIDPGWPRPARWRAILWLPVLLVLALLIPPLVFLPITLLFFELAVFRRTLGPQPAFSPALRSCRIPFRSPPLAG
ncbi:MAG: hypothetical protein WCB96_08340 [Candidatus Aminicenantales bacterium]